MAPGVAGGRHELKERGIPSSPIRQVDIALDELEKSR
jgi:hypothetical protein